MKASATTKMSNLNMSRSDARIKVRFPIIKVCRQAVPLVLFNFSTILCFNDRRGHA